MSTSDTVHQKLEQARHALLDLSGRNRLVNTPRRSSRSGRLEIVDELSQEVFRRLVQQGKAMSFLPAKEPTSDDEESSDTGELHLFQPEDDEQQLDENGLPVRHTDDKLQTRLQSDRLQKKLLKLYYDARTYEEEQGVNIFYLALGFLKWYEAENSDRERYAPLLLIPVSLDRPSAGSRFKINYTGDEISTNLSLQAKLKLEFGIELPDVPDVDDLDPNVYFARVTKAVSGKSRWEVLPNDIVLWFFSFLKFLMYRDLDPETWPDERSLQDHPLVTSLLQDGFRNEPPLIDDNEHIDRVLEPIDMLHIMDADGSQTVAIEEAKRGGNLVIQGPPGTGKSQTIANLIAAAVKEGKRVLFVAEKAAALEVVKRRLDNIGLGDMCLDLHRHRANKRAVLEELERTLCLGRPKVEDVARQAAELKAYRDKLNRHAEILHTPLQPAQVTPYQILGQLVRLQSAGVPPVDFKLENATHWSAADFRERLNLLYDLAAHLADIGIPRKHAWRGVQLDAVLPTDVARIADRLPYLIDRLDRLITAMHETAEPLQYGEATTGFDCRVLSRFATHLLQAPDVHGSGLASDMWKKRRSDINKLLQAGNTLRRCREQLDGVVADIAWSTDVSQSRRDLAAYGRSFFRIFYGAYRRAQATLRGIVAEVSPKPLQQRLELLDTLMQGQKARVFLEGEKAQRLGRQAFGELWQGAESDWDALNQLARWEADGRAAELPENFRQVAADSPNPDRLATLAEAVGEWKPILVEIRNLLKELKFNCQAAFGEADLRCIPLAELTARLEAWRTHPEALSKWTAYYVRRRKIESMGMAELVARLDEGLMAAAEAADRFRMAYFEELIRQVFRQYLELAEFQGISHEQLIERFRQLDTERIDLARREVALAHFEGLPVHESEVGEIGIVRREIKKKRRHLPLRKLLAQAGHAVQAMKPVFMMSPISVAQFLEPGVLEFDLLLIDEASQVRPVDALGAVARARQMVVVGDDRQLPPTGFFDGIAGDEGDVEDDGFRAGDLESILGLCAAQNVSQRMLQWHYRSRHHSLIAVSNREFYDNRLYVFPSPVADRDSIGLRFRYIRDGVFDRGGSATNRVEARAVADAAIEHAERFPDKSLGVGAFSVAQRDAILDELELRRREHPDLERFFAGGREEPFFVKNLENIQGDERDVIFISVGYGPDKSGYMSMGFGPLSNDGGERRLNVLMTRARERCEVFASFTADDIDLSRAKSRGAQALKTFLSYAATGNLDVPVPTGGGHDSPFEAEVAKAVEAYGLEVHPQVGVAGFFIDLAVIDPDRPGRYLLGIECDGAAYHSSRSARDRDRLRQQVLEDRGWIIHRIWSTDWFHRPEEQLRKTLAAIENAKVKQAGRHRHRRRLSSAPEGDGRSRDTKIERVQSDDSRHTTQLDSQPYVEADFPIATDRDIHEIPAPALAKLVVRVVQIEGPVHQDEIARRVTTLWGLKRTGRRITEAVDMALYAALDSGELVQDGSCFSVASQTDVPIRNRQNVQSTSLRKPELLPAAEIHAALQKIVAAHVGIHADDAVTEASRLFGFRSTSAQLRAVIEREIQRLTGDGTLEQRNGKLYLQQLPAEDG